MITRVSLDRRESPTVSARAVVAFCRDWVSDRVVSSGRTWQQNDRTSIATSLAASTRFRPPDGTTCTARIAIRTLPLNHGLTTVPELSPEGYTRVGMSQHPDQRKRSTTTQRRDDLAVPQTAPARTPRNREIAALTWENVGGRCWVRTNVGWADGFTDPRVYCCYLGNRPRRAELGHAFGMITNFSARQDRWPPACKI